MAKKSGKTSSKGKSPAAGSDGLPMGDIRHPSAKRRNIPPAKIAAEGVVPVIPKAQYAYNPHLPPVLRFDQHGKPDALPELLAKARRGPLSDDEARTLAEALRIHEPWLEWTGKREKPGFAVDPVALHIHERISAQAILKVAARQDASKFLFADPEQEYHEAVQFYRHDVDWANRLILGDSLQVMSSLARREDLAGKVQMIYMDPPYGIKFASNFQPEVGKRDVKDKQEDLTREPEMVRAYRDTWHLGIHSYLSYLRDRLVVARELLADTGSVFVQISDENVHRVRTLLDETFGPQNHVATIAYKTAIGMASDLIDPVHDYLLWYSRDVERVKFRRLYHVLEVGGEGASRFKQVESRLSGLQRLMTEDERNDPASLDAEWRPYRDQGLTSRSGSATTGFEVDFSGRGFRPPSGGWRTGQTGMTRVKGADRLMIAGETVNYKKFFDDSGVLALTNFWPDTGGGITSRSDPKVYVVQTSTTVVERCMLMTTDPGDLVLDPTCGSGTTAYVAEQWGRRWITTDTSRVAVAIARQRLLTAKFEQYKTKATRQDSRRLDVPDPSSGFHYKTVPHITLKSIAQNVALDPIFAKHEPPLEAALKQANAELALALKKDPSLRTKLAAKLAKKQKDEGKRAVTDADRRRWVLPPDNREKGVKYTVNAKFDGWYHWEMPFDTDPDWPKGLAEAVKAYRAAWRAKMDEVNACIAASADQEELVDQPEVVKGVTRVSGPFSVEAVQPPEMTLGDAMDVGPEFGGAPEDIKDAFEVRMVEATGSLEVANVGAYLDQMIRFLRADGVRFLNNKQMKWTRLEPLYESGKSSGFHAEGRWVAVGDEDRDPDGSNNVGVVFGPQYGPVTAKMVEELIKPAGRLYDHLVVAAFNFTAEAQAILNEGGGAPHPKLKIHFAHIRPDINPGMNGLLKESVSPGGGQLFTVFGQPRVRVDSRKGDDGTEYAVTMEGVDVYNPVDNSINSTGASKVAAWFLDGDYDGRTFCVTQAFFPDKSAWEKLQKALNGKDGPIDAERFEAFSSTTSLPFPAGKHKCAAVKVIDPRGNEVMSVHRLA
ncbi:MAG: DNA methyltransferase [bacterium]